MKRVITIKKVIATVAMICQAGLMMCACTPHASTQGNTAWTLADNILSINGANRVIFQSDIPYTISTPGTYAIGQSLTNVGAAPVITVNVPGVTIDLKGYGISTTAGATSGILFAAGSSGRVTNGTMRDFPSGCVNFNAALYGKVDSLFFRNAPMGVAATNMDDLVISNINGTSSVAAVITGSSHVVIRNCFMNNGIILNATNSSNIVVHDSFVSVGSLFTLTGVTDSIIEDCFAVAGPRSVINGSSNNVLRNVRMTGFLDIFLEISGASSDNLLENIAFTKISELSNFTGIDIGVGVSRTRIVRSIIKDVAFGQPAITDNGTDTEVVNCLFSCSGGPGITFAIVSNTDVVNNTANWWQNLSSY